MPEPAGRQLRLRYYLVAFSLTRSIINTMYRMVYPFMTVFARGLGVPVNQLAGAVALRSAVGLAAPLIASSADRRGRVRGMLLGLGLFAVGASLVVVRPTYLPFVAALLLTTIGKIMFDPAMQAHLGDRVQYDRRGQAIALTELGWSLAFLIGVPLMGFLIARGDWTAPFPWLAGGAVLAAFVLWRILPNDTARETVGLTLRRGLALVAAHRSAVAGLALGVLACAANESFSIIFGVWLEAAFSLKVAALSAAAAVIGLAELSGEGVVVTITDRLGKRRAVAIGLLLNSLAGLLLPVIGQTQAGALVGLFLFYITFEITVVSSLPMMTELVPEARATAMSANITGYSLGRVLGAAIGLALYPLGIQANILAVVMLNAAAIAVLIAFIRERAAPVTPAS
jgi:predicted MFS family arabinose efflux permease